MKKQDKPARVMVASPKGGLAINDDGSMTSTGDAPDGLPPGPLTYFIRAPDGTMIEIPLPDDLPPDVRKKIADEIQRYREELVAIDAAKTDK